MIYEDFKKISSLYLCCKTSVIAIEVIINEFWIPICGLDCMDMGLARDTLCCCAKHLYVINYNNFEIRTITAKLQPGYRKYVAMTFDPNL